MARKQRNNGKRYSDTEKMVACQIVRAAGGTLTDELLKQIQTVLKIPTLSWDTVQRWYNASVEPPKTAPASGGSRVPSLASVEISGLDYQKATAREIVEHTFRQYAKQANNKYEVETTEGKDAAKVMADMLKLLQLLDGLPTEIIAVASTLTKVNEELAKDGIGLGDALEVWFQEYQAAKAAANVGQVATND